MGESARGDDRDFPVENARVQPKFRVPTLPRAPHLKSFRGSSGGCVKFARAE